VSEITLRAVASALRAVADALQVVKIGFLVKNRGQYETLRPDAFAVNENPRLAAPTFETWPTRRYKLN
jgi:hypothetical protein